MEIKKFFNDNLDNMIHDLDRLVSVASVGTDAKNIQIDGKLCEAPYGEEALHALREVSLLACENGFNTNIFHNRMTEIDLFSDGEPDLVILAHADVVPAGNGWTYEPFRATLDGDKIYGRGTIDNKGPIIAALYAMKYINENVPDFNLKVRLLVGSDEERGSSDLAYYRQRRNLAKYVFTPDANYPVINTEKGRSTGSFVRTIVSSSVVKANGGTVINAVPDRAYATIRGYTAAALNKVATRCTANVRFEFTENGNETDVCVYGAGAHASLPEGGENAITALFQFLELLDPAWSCVTKVSPHGDIYGNALGINCQDDISGKLTYAFDIFEYDGENFKGKFDIRYPVCMPDTKLESILRQSFSQNGFDLIDYSSSKPHHTDADSKLVRTLLSVYEKVTGNKGQALAVGGGTYAHGIPGAVAFGPEMPGEDNHMHAENEFISVDNLKLTGEMMCRAMIKLDNNLL